MKNLSDRPADVSGLSPEAVERATKYPRVTMVELNMYGEGLKQSVAANEILLAAETDSLRRQQLKQSIERYRAMHRTRFMCEPEQRDALRALANQTIANEEKTER